MERVSFASWSGDDGDDLDNEEEVANGHDEK